MLLFSLLLAATVSKTTPAVVPECQVNATVQEVSLQPSAAQYTLKLKINTVEDKCSGIFPKGTVIPMFINKTEVKQGDNLVKGTIIEGVITYKDTAIIKSYKLAASEQASLSPAAPAAAAAAGQTTESFFTWLITTIRGLFSRGK